MESYEIGFGDKILPNALSVFGVCYSLDRYRFLFVTPRVHLFIYLA